MRGDFIASQKLHVHQEVPAHQQILGEDLNSIPWEHDQSDSNSHRNDSIYSKPLGFRGNKFQDRCDSFQYSGNCYNRSWSIDSVKILKKLTPSGVSASCDEVSTFIEWGKVLGYDVENAKIDLKKRLADMGVIMSTLIVCPSTFIALRR